MFQPQLGFAAIINNLHSQVPDTADDVQALRAALETVGFNVKCYDDCNVRVKFRFFQLREIFCYSLQSLYNMKMPILPTLL